MRSAGWNDSTVSNTIRTGLCNTARKLEKYCFSLYGSKLASRLHVRIAHFGLARKKVIICILYTALPLRFCFLKEKGC